MIRTRVAYVKVHRINHCSNAADAKDKTMVATVTCPELHVGDTGLLRLGLPRLGLPRLGLPRLGLPAWAFPDV